MGYDPSDATWEPEVHIPGFIKEYYSDSKKIGTELPKPVIKHQKTLSDGQTFYLLGWDGSKGEEWVDESVFSIFESSIETTTSCNTRD